MSKQRSKTKDADKIVTIKPLAYYKMLLHILRFGNKARDHRQYREVMGVLIGHLEGEGEYKNVVVEDAVPISHGGSIEVEFSAQDYGTFAMVDEEAFSKGKHAVGWYHSHPRLSIFWSSTDIKNQLFWQTANNPSGIGIVFDHTYLENEGDLGFRAFRLDDYSKGMKSNYHEVKTIVEPPDNLEYYLKIMELINCVHSQEPPILEISETADPFSGIFLPEKSQLLSKKPELNLSEIFSALQKGISNFIALSVDPLIRFLNNWSQEIIRNVMENNLEMRSDLVELKESIREGIGNLQNYFKESLTDKFSQIDDYIDNKFDSFDRDRESIKKTIESMKDELAEKINKLFAEKFNISIDEMSKILDDNSKIMSEINQKSVINSENLEKQLESYENLSVKIKSIENSAINKLKDFQGEIEKALTEKIDKFTENLNNINKEIKDLDAQQQDLINKIKELKG